MCVRGSSLFKGYPTDTRRTKGPLAAAAAAVTATAVVAVVGAEAIATAAAQQDEDDNEPRAVSVTHIGKPPFELHSILWWEKKSVTAGQKIF